MFKYERKTARQRKDEAAKKVKYVHISNFFYQSVDEKTGKPVTLLSKGVTYTKAK